MAKTKDKKKKAAKGGKRFKATGSMGPKIHKGLNEDRMKAGGGRFAERVEMKQGEVSLVQFLTLPSEFIEIDQHQFKDGGKWNYIPCGGDGCPMCADDDEKVSKVNYRFFACVYDFKKKKVAILEGPKTLSGKIFKRFKGNKKAFLSRTWEISKEAGSPVTYDIERGEKKPVSTKGMELIDIEKNIIEQFKYHMGGDVDVKALSEELGADESDAADALDDEVVTKKQLKKLVEKDKEDELMTIAKNFGIKKKKLKAMDSLDDIAKAILKAQG